MRQYSEILNQILQEKIVAILRVKNVHIAKRAIEALSNGGIKNIEVTMNVPGVLNVLADESTNANVMLGAGTVLDEVSCRLAILNGAEFIVTPTLNAEVIKCANRYQKPVICGCMTPTEIITAMELGVHMIKVFPANQLQYNFITSVNDPLPQAVLGPTGGVNLDNIKAWQEAGAAFFGISGQFSALANQEKFEALEKIAADYRKAVS